MPQEKSAVVVGASRGLGLAIAEELLRRGWHVVATARQGKAAQLEALGARFGERLAVEHVDITETPQIAALGARLAGRSFDLLFVSAGIGSPRHEPVGAVATEEFVRVMVTNALSPMRVIEALADDVRPGGVIGAMSSGQGSVADNERGGFEVYRASKAALNTLMRSFAARRAKDRALLLLAPGWIRTDMGGPEASFTVEETIPDIVDTLVAQQGQTGLRYLDRFGKPVRW